MQPVGSHVPASVVPLDAPSLDPELAAALRRVSGLSATVSDRLDALGLRLTIPATILAPLAPGQVVVGRVVTLRYLPERRTVERAAREGESLMAHRTLFGLVRAGDVAVIAGPPGLAASLLGGEAAAAGLRAGLAGCILGGAARDVDEIIASGLPCWAAAYTPVAGRYRIEAVEINGGVEVAGVQIRAGDIAIADPSGIAFVPPEHLEELEALAG